MEPHSLYSCESILYNEQLSFRYFIKLVLDGLLFGIIFSLSYTECHKTDADVCLYAVTDKVKHRTYLYLRLRYTKGLFLFLENMIGSHQVHFLYISECQISIQTVPPCILQYSFVVDAEKRIGH